MKKVLAIFLAAMSLMACEKQMDLTSKNAITIPNPNGPLVPVGIPKNNCKVLHVTVKPFKFPKSYAYLPGLAKMFQFIDYDNAGRPVRAHYEYNYNYFTMHYDNRGNLAKINVYLMNDSNLVGVFYFTHTGGIGNNYSSSIAIGEHKVANGQQQFVQATTLHYDSQYRIVRAELKGGQQKYWYYYDAKGNLDRINESAWAAPQKPYLRFYDYDGMRSPNTMNRVWQILSGYHYVNNPRKIDYHNPATGAVTTQRYTYTYQNFYPAILDGSGGGERMVVYGACK